MKAASSLSVWVLLLLLTIPGTAFSSEGPALLYYLLAPLSLIANPFLLIAICVSLAIVCYSVYRASRESRGQPTEEAVTPVTSPEPPAGESMTLFVCPECRLAGKIADARLPKQGLTATCPRCKTRFPVKPADSRIPGDSFVSPASDAYAAAGAEPPAANKSPEAEVPVAPGKKFTWNWKKLLSGMAMLLFLNWVGQTLLLNALIVLGSNAGAKFTLLAPQALLPWTLPTQVSFFDKTGNKALAGKQVRVTWEYHAMGILPQSEARYADQVYTTDAQGKIRLPCRLKPPATYLMAFYHTFDHGIFLYLNDPGYVAVSDMPYAPPRIQGERLAETIAYTPCRSPEEWERVLGSAYMHPYSFLKQAVDGIVARTRLEKLDDAMLDDLAERCSALVTPAARQVDDEVARRGPQRIYAETYIRTLIRLGRNDEAIAGLPLLAGRPHAEEWQQYFGKFLEDLTFEKEIEREAAPLVVSGKSAAQLHEEGLSLHKQHKQRQSLPYYQASIFLAPQSSRFHNNYAVAATDLKHYFLAEMLSRKAILYDPNRSHAYRALGRALIASNRNAEAYLLLKESLRLGYNDSFTWTNLAIVADNLKFTKEARAAVKEARKLDPNNPDLPRFRHLEN